MTFVASPIRSRIPLALGAALLCAAGAMPAFAQAASDGGSLGGSLAPAASTASAHRKRPAAAPRAPRRAPQGGGGSFDGAWQVSSGGQCSGAGTGQVTISGGRIIGQNGGGHVSPSGAVSTVSNFGGTTSVGRGRIIGRTASGTYRQSDGCLGTWSAVKL